VRSNCFVLKVVYYKTRGLRFYASFNAVDIPPCVVPKKHPGETKQS